MENYNDLINEYLFITDTDEKLSINDKFTVLTSKLNSKNIEGIEYIKYANHLREILFSDEERKNNFEFAIIKDNDGYEISENELLSAILTINKKGFNENLDYNVYYRINSNTGILPISQSNLQEKFTDETYELIDEENYKVPGIETSKAVKR